MGKRAIAEVAFLIGLAAALVVASVMVHQNLASHNIATGFGFLFRDTGWDVSSSLIPHSPRDLYWRTFLIGLLNTLALSAGTIVIATMSGFLLALMRQLNNKLLSWLIGSYVTIVRNVPLIVQIFFWYAATQSLPNNRAALHIPGGAFLSNRGLYFPSLSLGWPEFVLLVVLGLLAVMSIRFRRRRRGLIPAATMLAILIWLVSPIAFGVSAPAFEWPQFKGLNFTGGLSLQPELVALTAALVVYSTAFVAEIVRAGVQSVPLGQVQAAQNIGLTDRRLFWKIIMPQAVRVMVLPMINQYVNIIKATALAIVVGYTDLFSVSVITINHTGQALEVIAILMLLYFVINASVSLLGNCYQRLGARRWTR